MIDRDAARDPRLVADLYEAALGTAAFDRLVWLLAGEAVLSRGLDGLEREPAAERRETIRQVVAGGGGHAGPMIAAALDALDDAEREAILTAAASAAARRTHAAAVRVVVGARALRAEVEVTDGAADMVVIWATGMLPDEVAATLGELGEGAE